MFKMWAISSWNGSFWEYPVTNLSLHLFILAKSRLFWHFRYLARRCDLSLTSLKIQTLRPGMGCLCVQECECCQEYLATWKSRVSSPLCSLVQAGLDIASLERHCLRSTPWISQFVCVQKTLRNLSWFWSIFFSEWFSLLPILLFPLVFAVASDLLVSRYSAPFHHEIVQNPLGPINPRLYP